MGNRAIVTFINQLPDGLTASAATADLSAIGAVTGVRIERFSVYQQWGADDVKDRLKEAAKLFRPGMPDQCAARWTAHLCGIFEDGYSVYLTDHAFDPENGLYVVDCTTGNVWLLREGAEGLAACGRPFKIKFGLA